MAPKRYGTKPDNVKCCGYAGASPSGGLRRIVVVRRLLGLPTVVLEPRDDLGLEEEQLDGRPALLAFAHPSSSTSWISHSRSPVSDGVRAAP